MQAPPGGRHSAGDPAGLVGGRGAGRPGVGVIGGRGARRAGVGLVGERGTGRPRAGVMGERGAGRPGVRVVDGRGAGRPGAGLMGGRGAKQAVAGEASKLVGGRPGVGQASDGGYRWLVLVAAFTCSLLLDGIAFTFGLFYIEFIDYFQESKSKTAWIGSAFNGNYLFVGETF